MKQYVVTEAEFEELLRTLELHEFAPATKRPPMMTILRTMCQRIEIVNVPGRKDSCRLLRQIERGLGGGPIRSRETRSEMN